LKRSLAADPKSVILTFEVPTISAREAWIMRPKVMPLPNPLITINPGLLSGAPAFTGTRVPIQSLFDYLEGGDTLDEFLHQFPNVTREHAVAVLELAQRAVVAQSLPAAAE
jgi:uncharacterized protein (DUF433 family)